MFYRLCWYIAVLSLKWWYRVKVLNKNNRFKKGKCVGICNHFSLMDVPLVGLAMYRQPIFISKKELYRKRSFQRWFFLKLGAIPIERDAPDITAMKACLKALKDEKMLMVFPEGTRNKSGTTDLQEIKNGAALFAIKGKAPVIPMALAGKARPWRRNYVMFGEPFDFSALYGKKITPEDLEACGEVMREKMIAVKSELDAYIASGKRGKRKSAGGAPPQGAEENAE